MFCGVLRTRPFLKSRETLMITEITCSAVSKMFYLNRFQFIILLTITGQLKFLARVLREKIVMLTV